MTPRQIKEALYEAARTNDFALALLTAKEFESQGLWTSTPHWNPTQPDGTEKFIIAKKPGTCVICNLEFSVGEPIRWRSRVDCHVECWNKIHAR